jgi:hypothetical protein
LSLASQRQAITLLQPTSGRHVDGESGSMGSAARG